MEKGMEKGMEQGMEQGRMDTARNLKKLGVSAKIIMQSTGLSEEQIENL